MIVITNTTCNNATELSNVYGVRIINKKLYTVLHAFNIKYTVSIL